MAVEVCKFNQKGFRKFGDECRKRHVKEICANRDCKDESCLQRHPQLCRYFVFNRSCRFKDGCAFEHRDSDEKTKIKDLEAKLAAAEAKVAKLEYDVEEIKFRLESFGQTATSLPSVSEPPDDETKETFSEPLKEAKETSIDFKCNICDFTSN